MSVLAALVAAAGVALHLSRSANPTVLVLATFAFAAWLFCLVALVAALSARSLALTSWPWRSSALGWSSTVRSWRRHRFTTTTPPAGCP